MEKNELRKAVSLVPYKIPDMPDECMQKGTDLDVWREQNIMR